MYKQTTEYAYDLLEHFYNINILYLETNGIDKVEMLVPQEIYDLLKARDMKTKEIIYPEKFKSVTLTPYEGSTIDFVLKKK